MSIKIRWIKPLTITEICDRILEAMDYNKSSVLIGVDFENNIVLKKILKYYLSETLIGTTYMKKSEKLIEIDETKFTFDKNWLYARKEVEILKTDIKERDYVFKIIIKASGVNEYCQKELMEIFELNDLDDGLNAANLEECVKLAMDILNG
ncbi:MAG: hypothetical protein ACRDD7_15095 [Peptostreptococcaceae bacterium]